MQGASIEISAVYIYIHTLTYTYVSPTAATLAEMHHSKRLVEQTVLVFIYISDMSMYACLHVCVFVCTHYALYTLVIRHHRKLP